MAENLKQKKADKVLFGKFEILECYKQDEHAAVYLARHLFLEKKIILKTLNTSNLPDTSMLKRFQREARILAGIEHPHIIAVYDFGSEGDQFYISFEYFPSQHLRRWQSANNPVPEKLFYIARQLSEALAAAHAKGVIHRDIKPENILIGETGHVKIADFGLALVNDESGLTGKSSIVGTPAYMSPEQIRGASLSPASDLFSLGTVLLEMLSGENPFLGGDVGQTINAVQNVNEAAVIKQCSALPPPFNTLIPKLLQRDPAGRPTANDVAQQLGGQGSRVEKKTTGHNRLVFAVTAAFLLILIWLLPTDVGDNYSLEIPQTGDSIPEPKLQLQPNSPHNESAENPSVQPVEIEPEADKQRDETLMPQPMGTMLKNTTEQGLLLLDTNPATEVRKGDSLLGRTPFSDPVRLDAGLHNLLLYHPDYPPVTIPLHVTGGQTLVKRVALDTLFAYLDCQVYPWGEVIIDGKAMGQSPFPGPFRLLPGKHLLQVRNPGFEEISHPFEIARNDTLQLMIDLLTENR